METETTAKWQAIKDKQKTGREKGESQKKMNIQSRIY